MSRRAINKTEKMLSNLKLLQIMAEQNKQNREMLEPGCTSVLSEVSMQRNLQSDPTARVEMRKEAKTTIEIAVDTLIKLIDSLPDNEKDVITEVCVNRKSLNEVAGNINKCQATIWEIKQKGIRRIEYALKPFGEYIYPFNHLTS